MTFENHAGIVLEQGAAQNTIQSQNLQGRYLDHAGEGSNRIRSQEPDGLRSTAPEFLADKVWIAKQMSLPHFW